MQFVLPILEDNKEPRQMTTLHMMLAFLLCAIGATCGGLYWFTAVSPAFDATGGAYTPFLVFGILCFLAGIAIMVLNIYQKQWMRRERNHFMFRAIELVLMVSSCVLFYARGWKTPAMLFGLMSLVILFAFFWEKKTAKRGEITIDETGVKMPVTSRTRFVEWIDVDRVILRFGTLTVECADNRLLQKSVEQPAFAIDELEHFCKNMVDAHRSKRDKNNW